MILTRTPLRVSLFGGGSDLPSYCNENTGHVLSTSIDKYMYIAMCKTAYPGIKVVYNDIELVDKLEDIKHSRVREALRYFKVDNHIEISSYCEIPTKGTGLGSSSSFTVGLLNALEHTVMDGHLNKFDLARLASDIEINTLGEPIGRQDQYAAAVGGFNVLTFNGDKVEVRPVGLNQTFLRKLEKNLLMFYTGQTRDASSVLAEQSTKDNKVLLDRMSTMALEAEKRLQAGQIDDVGAMLHEAWELKKQLAGGVSNYFIDLFYNKAMKNGALGGKILGAGGGGYLLFYVQPEVKSHLRYCLEDLQEVQFKFEDSGTTVVYNESKRTF